MVMASEWEAWYDNGFGSSDWKVDKASGLVKDCELHITADRLALHRGRHSVTCPWSGVRGLSCNSSNRGNAVLSITLAGDKGGSAKVVVPGLSPNSLWVEFWRAAPVLRPRIERLRPETAGTGPAAQALFDYLGGYPLQPKPDSSIRVVLDPLGVFVVGGVRDRLLWVIAWKDVIGISVAGMMDAQRERSLARTVEFGAVGGLAGKQVKSSYLTISTAIGDAIFHAKHDTVPELRAKYAAVLPVAERMVASRAREPQVGVADSAPHPSSRATASLADELTKLAALRDAGVLSDEEFAAQKAKLLS